MKLINNNPRLLRKYTAKPTFKQFQIFSPEVVGLETYKSSVLLNKPIYCGFTVLELSKLIMYDFYYNYLKAKYLDALTLCYSDTDSFLVHIVCEDPYQDMAKDKHLYDCSDFDRGHICFSEENKKTPGKMKDEYSGKIIDEVVCLRPKMYSIKMGDAGEKSKLVGKGIPRVILKNRLTHEEYKKSLFENKKSRATAHLIQSERHNIFTKEVNKLALNPIGVTKRVLLKDNITSVPLGYYKLQDKKWCEENVL